MNSSQFQLIDDALFQETQSRARNSLRKRANHNFHDLNEVYQRFLNVLCRGTYVQPHRHRNVPKPETFIALQGELGFLLFDDSGEITDHFLLSSSGPRYGIDIQPGVWHSIVCITETCICFEGKSGPYNPDTDKEFADFAPAEGEPGVLETLQKWEALFSRQSTQSPQ